jgi:hypothetical protein
MAIMVQYLDRSYGFEENRVLDELIVHKRIIAFRRASGWAEIGRDPVRDPCAVKEFDGVERRGQAGAINCLTCAHFVDSACRQNNCPARTTSQAKSGENR